MENGKMEKTVAINAPASKVWDVLTQDKYNRIWYAAFHEGTHAVTNWKQGSKVAFLDGDNNGVFGKIVESKPNEIISMIYEGVIDKGEEITTGDDAKSWIGSTEIYTLTGSNGNTSMLVELAGPAAQYMAQFMPMWDEALQKIKALSEE